MILVNNDTGDNDTSFPMNVVRWESIQILAE